MTPATALPDFVLPLDGGVFAVDTGFHRPRFDAAYLVVDGGRAAFVDTGTHFAVPRLLQALDAVGLPRDAVDWVIPTHVHLDHAGGVGTLMRALPAARCLVHPRGVRHLVDPTMLWAGASAVYGDDEMQRSYGEVVPVAADRVVASSDGGEVALGARALATIHTPGHARHHHCVWEPVTRGWFTGDTFGLSYREFDTAQGPWILPTSTPVQFEPERLRESIERLLAADPRCVYLTHFGRCGEPARLGRQLLTLLDGLVALGRAQQAAGLRGDERHRALKDGQLALFTASLRAHGDAHAPAAVAELLAMDLELNAQGIAIWLDREAGVARRVAA